MRFKCMPKVAVAGATGNVGRKVLEILSEHDYPVELVTALSSSRSGVMKCSYGTHDTLCAMNIDNFNFDSVEVVLGALPTEIMALYSDKMNNCVIIDNSSLYRMEEDVPLIIPEINGNLLNTYKGNIIASPNCVVTQLLMALYPLHCGNPIKRAVISTYQSVSGAGIKAMDELYSQTKGGFTPASVAWNKPKTEPIFQKRIAFNCIPQIDSFMADGQTREEYKIRAEAEKICGINVTATCVRVPVFVGHGIAAHIEFTRSIKPQSAEEILRNASGIGVVSAQNEAQYLTQIECVQEDLVFVSRIRPDHSVKNGLSMWIVGDNIRKGAALNVVQILQQLSHNNDAVMQQA